MLALLNPDSLVKSAGYFAIFFLSVLQSCCVPTSSELTLGYGGYLASQGTLSLPGVIAAGTLGEVVGAYIAWVIGKTGGRRFVDRFGRYLLLSHHDLDKAEAWYQRHSRWGVLGSRLVPVIRNFVALPAGAAEVPLIRFGAFTALGSLIWDGAMALIGYSLGGSWTKIMKGFSDAGYLIALAAVAAIAFVFYHRYRSYRAATAGDRQAMEDARRPSGVGGERPTGGSRAAGASRPAEPSRRGPSPRTGATASRRPAPPNVDATTALDVRPEPPARPGPARPVGDDHTPPAGVRMGDD